MTDDELTAAATLEACAMGVDWHGAVDREGNPALAIMFADGSEIIYRYSFNGSGPVRPEDAEFIAHCRKDARLLVRAFRTEATSPDELPISEADFAAMRRRCAAASNPPWIGLWGPSIAGSPMIAVGTGDCSDQDGDIFIFQDGGRNIEASDGTFEFIGFARQEIARLVAEADKRWAQWGPLVWNAVRPEFTE